MGFTVEEYQLIQEWLYIINQMGNDEDIDSIFRCIDTIDLFKKQSQQGRISDSVTRQLGFEHIASYK